MSLRPRFLLPALLAGPLLLFAPPARALNCQEIMNMVNVGVPTNIVVQTIQDSGEVSSSEGASCLLKEKAPAEVQAAWKARLPAGKVGAEAPKANPPPALPSPETSRDPPALLAAIDLYNKGKEERAAPAFYQLLSSEALPDREVKLRYYLGKSLQKHGLPSSAQVQLIEVLKKGTSTPYFPYALQSLVSIAKETSDWTDIDRIFPKIPAESVPRAVKATYSYRMGLRAVEEGDFTGALRHLDLVPEKDLLGLQATYLRGVIHTKQGKLKSGMRSFSSVVKGASGLEVAEGAEIRKMDLLVDLSILNIGRIYYSIERYEEAARYDAQVSAAGNAHSQAAYEGAWAAFMLGDGGAARARLGAINSNATSLKKRAQLLEKGRDDEIIWPGLWPEAQMLDALLLYADCRYDEAEALLLRFESEQQPLSKELVPFLTGYASEEGKKRAENAFDAFFRSSSADLARSRSLAPLLLQDQELAGLVEHLKGLDQELSLIDRQPAAWASSGLQSALHTAIAAEQVRLHRRSALSLLAGLATRSNTLKDLLSQSEILRFELLDNKRTSQTSKTGGAAATTTCATALKGTTAKGQAAAAAVKPLGLDTNGLLQGLNPVGPTVSAQKQQKPDPNPTAESKARSPRKDVPAAGSADEDLPRAVLQALERAGWTPTFSHSATFTAGDILRTGTSSPAVFGKECFDAEPREGSYTSLEVVQALQAGGRLPLLGAAQFKAEGMQYKQVRFADPFVSELSEMTMRPNRTCLDYLRSQQSKGEDLSKWVVIQAVMKAEIKEQVCRELEAGGGLGAVGLSASMSSQCVQGSNGQVAVAFKLRPVEDLIR